MKLMLIIAGAVIALALLFGFSALVVGKKSDKKGADDDEQR